MDDYKKTYGWSIRQLRATPGFRKLWDALEEAAHMNSDPDLVGGEHPATAEEN